MMTLAIRVGSSRESGSLNPCPINKDSEPVFISSDHFEGLITVRIQRHHPAPSSQSVSTCTYFDNHSRVFSLQWQGRFKATNPSCKDRLWDADEVLFVAEVENRIYVPMGTSIATAFARTIDPSFIADGIWETKRPWVGSPLVSGMNVLRAWRATPSESTADLGAGDGKTGGDITESQGEKRVGPWAYFGAHRLQEGHLDLLMEAGARRQRQQRQDSSSSSIDTDTSSTLSDSTAAAGETGKSKVQGLTSYQRRRYFTRAAHRQAAVLHPDVVVAGDFFNNFTDFETRRVSMGVSIRMERVLEDQPLRFVCKSRPFIKCRTMSKRGHKHEVGSSVSSRGGEEEEEEEMYVEGGDVDERSREMDEIVFFVVELQWDGPS